MGITERREREKLELRRRILMKAKDILLTEGWSQLSIRNIAKGVEYSPATIYLYFEGKDEIVFRLMEVGLQQLMKKMEPTTLIQHPVDRLNQLGKSFVEFGLENSEWFELLFNTPKDVCPIEKYLEDSSPGYKLFDLLLNTCEEAIQSGYTEVKDAEILAMLLWSSVQGLVNLIRSKNFEHLVGVEEHELIVRTIDTLTGSLFNY